jgi:S-adenosylmethionine-dependent methyltransferase
MEMTILSDKEIRLDNATAAKMRLIRYTMKSRGNYRSLDGEKEKKLKNEIIKYLGEKELSTHLYGRLTDFRKRVIPWLESVCSLKNLVVLEIGCGTGCSTVALCEQGANVTAIDINDCHIELAKKRLDLYDLKANFKAVNAAEIDSNFPQKFKMVIFFASLEHMTYSERIRAIRAAYNIIDNREGGIIIIVETPNRLWFEDTHTSLCPFFNWLPDEVAVDYAQFTKREDFNTWFLTSSRKNQENLARWGRGVSFHDFEIALGGKSKIDVIGSMQEFLMYPKSEFTKLLLDVSSAENRHSGWFEPYLYLALKV